MKTGKHYFGLLTEEEQRNFKEVCDKREMNFNQIMETKYIDFIQFVQSIRPFIGTKQGHDYWFQVITTERTEQPKH